MQNAQITPIAQLLNLPDKTPIVAVQFTLTNINPPFHGQGRYGPYSFQNGDANDQTGQIAVVFKDMQPLPHLRGQVLFIQSQNGTRGLVGLKMGTDVYNGQSKRRIEIGPQALIATASGQVQTAPQQQQPPPQQPPQNYQPPPQQTYQQPPPQQPPQNYQPPPQQTYQQPPPQTGALSPGQQPNKPKPAILIQKLAHLHSLCLRAANFEAEILGNHHDVKMTPDMIQASASSMFICMVDSRNGMVNLDTWPALEAPRAKTQSAPQQQQFNQTPPPASDPLPQQPPPPPPQGQAPQTDDDIPF